MNDLRKAAEMALEEFELFFNTYPHMEKGYTLDAREALRQALAQPDEVLAEREACAEWLRDNYQDYKNIADICEAIRARGEK